MPRDSSNQLVLWALWIYLLDVMRLYVSAQASYLQGDAAHGEEMLLHTASTGPLFRVYQCNAVRTSFPVVLSAIQYYCFSLTPLRLQSRGKGRAARRGQKLGTFILLKSTREYWLSPLA